MRESLRDTIHQLSNIYPISRFRSVEERVGVIGFTLMLLFAMFHPV